MAKYYRVAEDLKVGDLVQLDADGRLVGIRDGEILGRCLLEAKAGKKLAASKLEEVLAVEVHDHDHDGPADHEAEDCDVVETEVIEVDPIPELRLEEVKPEEELEEVKPWWWKS